MWLLPCALGMSTMWLLLLPTNIFSTLMKLHKNHLGDSFRCGLENRADSQLASRVRECADVSYNAMRDTSLQVLNFAQSLERHVLVSGVDKLSPLVLHCLYRAAFWLQYLADASREDRFLIGRSVFDRVLNTLSLRWKAAGKHRSSGFVNVSH